MDLLVRFRHVPALYPVADIGLDRAGDTEPVSALDSCLRFINNMQRVGPAEEPEDLALFVGMDNSLRPLLHLGDLLPDPPALFPDNLIDHRGRCPEGCPHDQIGHPG